MRSYYKCDSFATWKQTLEFALCCILLNKYQNLRKSIIGTFRSVHTEYYRYISVSSYWILSVHFGQFILNIIGTFRSVHTEYYRYISVSSYWILSVHFGQFILNIIGTFRSVHTEYYRYISVSSYWILSVHFGQFTLKANQAKVSHYLYNRVKVNCNHLPVMFYSIQTVLSFSIINVCIININGSLYNYIVFPHDHYLCVTFNSNCKTMLFITSKKPKFEDSPN